MRNEDKRVGKLGGADGGDEDHEEDDARKSFRIYCLEGSLTIWE